MKRFLLLTKRNIKLYFSDKTMFFTSLITPAILLVLYASFLGGIFKDNFTSMMPEQLFISSKIINSLASGQILASLISVSCVTVAFTSNLLMVNDKVSGANKDINVSPINKYTISLSYFVASFISTILINLIALSLCLVYTATQGWFYEIYDILKLVADVFMLTLFGCALSSVINFNLKSQGQASAVGTIVSSGYGFICGAYMPISSFGIGLQKVLSFLPGTYGTSLVKNHALSSAMRELANKGVESSTIMEMKKGLDCSLTFFNHNVSEIIMYLIMFGTIAILLLIFIIQNIKGKNA